MLPLSRSPAAHGRRVHRVCQTRLCVWRRCCRCVFSLCCFVPTQTHTEAESRSSCHITVYYRVGQKHKLYFLCPGAILQWDTLYYGMSVTFGPLFRCQHAGGLIGVVLLCLFWLRRLDPSFEGCHFLNIEAEAHPDQSVVILHAKVAQKSYGNEKRLTDESLTV